MASAGRTYRTRLEILRDLLNAATRPSPKTRIIGIANLNPRSFREYLDFCLQYDLVRPTGGQYVVTPQGNTTLLALESLIAKTVELDSALHHLQQNLRHIPPTRSGTGDALRYISRWTWSEIRLDDGEVPAFGRSGAVSAADSPDSVETLVPPLLAETTRKPGDSAPAARGRQAVST